MAAKMPDRFWPPMRAPIPSAQIALLKGKVPREAHHYILSLCARDTCINCEQTMVPLRALDAVWGPRNEFDLVPERERYRGELAPPMTRVYCRDQWTAPVDPSDPAPGWPRGSRTCLSHPGRFDPTRGRYTCCDLPGDGCTYGYHVFASLGHSANLAVFPRVVVENGVLAAFGAPQVSYISKQAELDASSLELNDCYLRLTKAVFPDDLGAAAEDLLALPSDLTAFTGGVFSNLGAGTIDFLSRPLDGQDPRTVWEQDVPRAAATTLVMGMYVFAARPSVL